MRRFSLTEDYGIVSGEEVGAMSELSKELAAEVKDLVTRELAQWVRLRLPVLCFGGQVGGCLTFWRQSIKIRPVKVQMCPRTVKSATLIFSISC